MTDASPPPNRRFATTNWSVVVAAGRTDTPVARAALASLCRTYWYPLYAYARRRGADAHTAQDQVQDFFATLLDKHWMGDVDRERGRFRTFLLVAFRRHVTKLDAATTAQKRGGGRAVLALDFDDGEQRYALEPAHLDTPERVFERRWALTLLDRALDAVRTEFRRAGRDARFDVLRAHLDGASGAPSHRETAERLGMTEGAVKVAVHRMRQQYRALLRAEIAQTVDDPSEVDEEIRHLLGALAG